MFYECREYEVVLKRDIDKTGVINCNPEWIIVLTSNMTVEIYVQLIHRHVGAQGALDPP